MYAKEHRTTIVGLAVCLAGLAWGSLAQAQRIIEADAVLGSPFGVGRLVVQLPETILPQPLGLEGLGLSEKSGRCALSEPAQSGHACVPKGTSERRHPADLRRTRAAGSR